VVELQGLQQAEQRRASLSQLPAADTTPPLRQWARRAYWTPEEAAALFLGWDPDLYPWRQVERLVAVASQAREFAHVRDHVQRAIRVGDLEELPAPVDLLDWGAGLGLKVVPELEAAVRSLPRKGWKRRFEEASRHLDALKKSSKGARSVGQ
jgi:hypothetical protein